MIENTHGLSPINDRGEYAIKPEHVGLKELVARLDPKFSVLIELIYFQGYTHQEIGEELNMPLGTVKTRLRAAFVDLRKFFGVSQLFQAA